MAVFNFSDTLRNNRLDQFETTLAASPKLRIMSGAIPATCAAADTGTLLCEITLPADFMNPAATGSKTKLGTWSGTGAAAGTAAHFRIKNNAGTVVHCQGDVTAVGGGGAMTLDNLTIAVGQVVTVNTFTLTDGNG